jgi:acyl-CoA synthetase (AMP-forming)/AMP-acid ligase II
LNEHSHDGIPGDIELKDRKKDIIISGGVNISTIEAERVLYQHPDILEAAVVGVPDPYWGVVPKAFVILRPEARLREEEVIAFTRERLTHYKCPKEMTFGPLPKTSTGKVQKFKLREQVPAESYRHIRETEGRVAVVILKGEGPAFCAGNDSGEMFDRDASFYLPAAVRRVHGAGS